MAADYVKVTETPTDWSGDYLFVYEAENVAFNGGLATLDAASNTIAVTITDGKIAATDATNAAKFTLATVEGGYSIKSASGKFIGVGSYGNGLKQADDVGTYVHNSLTIDAESNAIIGIYNASWNTTGGTMILNFNANKSDKRFRYYKDGSQKKIQIYKYIAEEQGNVDPEPTTKTVYCKVAQDWWKADGAATGIYAFKGEAKNAAWPGVRMTAVEGETDLWKAEIDTVLYNTVIFTRMNPADGGNQDWGAKTADLVVPADKDLYTITSTTAVWGDPGVTGTWSVYGEEQGGDDTEQIKYYMTGEKATNWVGGWEPNDTPMHGDSAVFKGLVPGTRYQFKITGGSWGNNEKGFSSVNQASKDAGIYTTGDGGNIMFYMNKTGDVKVKVVDDLINVEGNFVHYFLAGNGEEGKAWAGGKDWWQDVAPLAGDSIVYDNLETDVTYEFKVLKYASWDNAMNINNVTAASKALGVKGNDNITFEMAEAGKVVIRVVGDSVALTGNFVKPAEPADPVYAISGAWNDFEKDLFVVAEDKKTASFSIDLEAGDYEFKIRKDDAWLTKANEGNAYGLHREWTGVAGVTDEATENLKLTADENGVYTFVWTFANDSIGVVFPVKHALNEVWKVTAETAVAAETKYVDNYALAISTVYAGTLKTNTRQFGGYAFTHAIQVRNAAYPSAENVNGTEQTGSTSLVMTAKENVEVTLFYIRQTGNEAENDGKDIIVYDQADLSKLTGAFAMVPSGTEGYYNTTKTLSLTKGHVYTVSAKGTTIQLSGIRYISDAAAPVVAPAKFYITGDSALVVNAGLEKEKAWAPNAIKSDTISYKLSLAAGDYMLKITLDGTWETVKGYDALTTVATGLTRGEGANNDNICFTLKEAGDVNVHYDGEYFFLNGNFYVAPVEVKYYLKNNWDGAEAWTWKEMPKDEYGTYMLGPVVFGGTGVNINTNTESDGDWIAAEDITTYDANYEPATLGALDTVVFMFDPEEVNIYNGANGLSAMIISKYVAPVVETPDFYIAGNMTNWADEKIAVTGTSYKLNLLAGDYQLKVIVGEGDAAQWIGYDALTQEDKAGLTADNDGNICFTLAEAGEVTVTYTAEIFTVTGNFYATPAVEDGYYLVGKIGGADQWSVSDLTAEKKFAANEQAAGEYVLSTTLAEGDAIKVVKVENNAIVTWYNDGGDNFAITADLAGKVVIYFRPEGNTDWGYYYFTVVKDTADGINTTAVAGKAVKTMINGELFILRDGKTYSVQGNEVR